MVSKYIRMQKVVLEGLRAIESPEVLSHIHQELGNTFAADAITIFAPLAGPGAVHQLHHGWGHMRGGFDDHFTWAWKLDPWVPAIASRGLKVLRNGVLSHELVAKSQLLQSAFYAEHLRPKGNLQHMMSCFVGAQPNLLAFAMLREGKQRAFCTADLHALTQLKLPLEAFFRGYEAVHQAQRAARLQASVLDAETAGLLLLDASANILVTNERARVWLGLRGIRANLATAHAQLWNACLDARSAPRQTLTVTLLSPTQVDPRTVTITWRGATQPAQIHIRFTDPAESSLDARVMKYALVSGLSTMETKVLRCLVDQTPAEVAAKLGVKLTTVRSHMSSIFMKTGKRRQSELLWALATA